MRTDESPRARFLPLRLGVTMLVVSLGATFTACGRTVAMPAQAEVVSPGPALSAANRSAGACINRQMVATFR